MALERVYRDLLAERADLLTQVGRIERAIVELGFSVPKAATTDATTPAEPGTDYDDSGAEPATGDDGTKSLLLRILKDQPNREFAAPAALKALQASGWSTKSGNPRNVVVSTLGKLARDGAIEKVRHGAYAYIPSPTRTEMPSTDRGPFIDGPRLEEENNPDVASSDDAQPTDQPTDQPSDHLTHWGN